MSAGGSTKVVVAALIGNGLIAVAKFTASAFTGSSAMLSEAIHSTVDTGNQALILYGLKCAKKPADDTHPFGYGMELYFWTFVVAILIFAIGSGVSLYEGVEKILNPHPVTDPWVNYLILGVAMIIEGAAWTYAFREFKASKGHLGYMAGIRESKDPAVFTVLMEDTAAMLGLAVAFVGIAVGEWLNMPVLDGVASIFIGVILAIVAVILAVECKGLLIGEGARSSTVRGIRAIATATVGVKGVNELLTMHLGPRDILVTLSLDFTDDITSEDVETLISTMEREIKESYDDVTRVFIEAQSQRGHQADTQGSLAV
ncbi:MAG: cation transporter [Rhodospirillales bacterium]|jgi:cation diffusion facilitator family transporter|nr:cation transporter [Rhodospirillales bacterium]MBT4039847.1 cation transporter [Rhodospirillales bacterium]MBT4627479.1 cation transporter [Rhodospirillales bacterium]MBT5350979.1 cation transporter [Rhodospirillales bacterium]MBT5520601.1 cation transporter [Rhodospirillales bacterium]